MSFQQPSSKRPLIIAGVVLIASAALGVSLYNHSVEAKEKGKPVAAAPAGAPAAMPVMVKTVSPENVRLWSSFSGRMEAVDYAEIRPQVSGRIQEIKFKDGDTVQAGDVLLVIDPSPYEAAVAKAEANLNSAINNASFAKNEAVRAENLVKTQAIPGRLFDERANDKRVAEANVLAARADLKEAKINLDYAYVKAPISGRVSRAEITVGNLVQAGPGAPLLTSIVSSDGIYADFEIDEQTYLKSIRAQAQTPDMEREIPVELTVRNDESHVYKGKIYSFDNKIDTASGTIRARAKFANEDGSLMPGMFVSVKLASNSDAPVLLIPETAVGTDQNKKFVYVVGDDNKVHYREVVLGAETNSRRVVTSGLNAGDRVIAAGVQMMRPDMVVAPMEMGAQPPAADPAAAEAAPEAHH